MFGSIKYNLQNLANVNGRDSRQTFWYYILFLVVIQILISFAISIPMTISVMGQAFEAVQNGIDQDVLQAQMISGMGGWLQTTIWIGVLTSLLMIVMAFAAFVRRLHDSNHCGLWVALPVAAQLGQVAVNIVMMDSLVAAMGAVMQPDNLEQAMAFQEKMTLYSLIGWIAPIVIVIFGVMKSTDGPNQYGDAPVRF